MALSSPSLFLWSFTITTNNQFITFVNTAGTQLATITIGNYSLTGLGQAIVQALQAQDTVNTYTFTVDRTIMGGTQNRVTITSTDTTFSLLFSSGSPSNPATLLGFTETDFTGATHYTGSASAGIALIPNQLAYTFLDINDKTFNQGARNVSASGIKETITFSVQYFLQAMFKYIPANTKVSQWAPFVLWMIQQNEFEFTPQISDPTTFYVVTLDDPNQGMRFDFQEMLPDFPNNYQTPLMVFRQRTAIE